MADAGPEGSDISLVRTGHVRDPSVGTGRPRGSLLLLPAWMMWKEVRGRLMAEGQGLIGLSPDGRQLGRGTNQALLPPFLVISGMRRQGGNLQQMEGGPEEFGMSPRGPALRK